METIPYKDNLPIPYSPLFKRGRKGKKIMRLIGDIGGTNARLALADEAGKVLKAKTFLRADFESVSDAIKEYQKITSAEISEIILAINMPVVDNKPQNNSYKGWGFDADVIAKDFKVKKVIFVNDMIAHAMSLPHLTDDDYEQISGTKAKRKETIVAIGLGTGVGVAFGAYDNGYKFFPSETGHQLVSSTTLKQSEVLNMMIAKRGFAIWDWVASGTGIGNLYEALFEVERTTNEVMKELSKKDKEAFDLYCEFLGVFVRNISTTFLPYGGIFIMGGVFSRQENIELLKESRFMDFYHFSTPSKDDYMSNIPIYVVNNGNTALIGLANF